MKIEEFEFKRLTYSSNGNELEELILKPQGDGPFPSVILVHGHNMFGAWDHFTLAYFLAADGYVSVLPSQVGYGFSKGQRDFCGPMTVQGIIDGAVEASKLSYIDKNNIAIWGISRGATAASQVITKEQDLFKAAVLQSGAYDMKYEFHVSNSLEGIKEVMVQETSGTDNDWEARSSILNANKIDIPVLILHGRQDDRVSVEQAELMDKKLTELNKEHETIILEDEGHIITKQTRAKYTFPFLAKYLKK